MRTGGFGLAIVLAMLAPAFSAGADDGSRLIEKAEMSMLVKGSIDLRPDGNVERYSIDHADALSPAITRMIGTQVSQWRFEPILVDGKPVAARTNMSLRIVAKPIDAQNFDVRIRSAYFWGDEGDDARLGIRRKTSVAPMVDALMSTGLSAADLFLALKIGPDGRVQDAIVEQVNLPTLYPEAAVARLDQALSQATLKVVREWTFDVPVKGARAGQPYWSGFFPVYFRLEGEERRTGYGKWTAYVPGPCMPVPWRIIDKGGDNSRCGNDAAPEGMVSLDNAGPKLLTPLMQGG